MIRSGALYISVVLALLVVSICFAILSIAYFNRLQAKKLEIESRLENNFYSALNFIRYNTDEFSYTERKNLDLFGEGRDSVLISRQEWGVFDLFTVISFSGNKSVSGSFLAGHTSDPKKSALYLADLKRPVYLAGKAEISGPVFFPEAGYDLKYSTLGRKAVNGAIGKSSAFLPPCKRERVYDVFKVRTGTAEIPDSVSNPFLSEELVFHTGSAIDLTGKKISGRVRIISDKQIHLGPGAFVEDIILIAPYIEVSEGFKGSLQLFAFDSIVIGTNCSLSYPSVAGILSAGRLSAPKIRFKTGSGLNGTVFALKEDNLSSNPDIEIEKNAQVTGCIYSEGFLDLRGNIYGHAVVRKLRSKTLSGIKENYLLDGKIDSGKLPGEFAGDITFFLEGETEIVKWLQ